MVSKHFGVFCHDLPRRSSNRFRLSVCLLAGLLKKLWTDLHENLTEVGTWPSLETINFWNRFGSGARNFWKDSLPLWGWLKLSILHHSYTNTYQIEVKGKKTLGSTVLEYNKLLQIQIYKSFSNSIHAKVIWKNFQPRHMFSVLDCFLLRTSVMTQIEMCEKFTFK